MKKNFLILAFATATCLPTQSEAAIVSLGVADSFAVLAGSTVTNTGVTHLEGDIGVSPSSAITGFLGTNENDGPGTFSGTAYQAVPTSLNAQADALTAYNSLAGLPMSLGGLLTGQTLGTDVALLAPGVYKFDTTAQLTGELFLSGAGDYVFQIGTGLTTAPGSMVTLINGATADNVFWQVGSSATLDTTTDFSGTIIADQSITMNGGATLEGRALALNAAVTLINNQISVPVPVIIPEPAAPALLTLAGLLFMGRRRRTV